MTARMTRQELLQSPEPPYLLSMIDESALRRVVGGISLMREQLSKLLEVAATSNVTMQVVPLEAGAQPGLDNTFMLLEFIALPSPRWSSSKTQREISLIKVKGVKMWLTVVGFGSFLISLSLIMFIVYRVRPEIFKLRASLTKWISFDVEMRTKTEQDPSPYDKSSDPTDGSETNDLSSIPDHPDQPSATRRNHKRTREGEGLPYPPSCYFGSPTAGVKPVCSRRTTAVARSAC